MWHSYFDNIYLINLDHRWEKREASTKILNDLEIPFELVDAIYNQQYPCKGLVMTMQKIMTEALDKGFERILIFEDDIQPMVGKDEFNEAMNGGNV